MENTDSALLMLSLGRNTVRRQWVLDPVKATNSRLVATQLFDRDLRQLRLSVLESADSAKFELGVSSLMFLLGFSAAVQLETNAPDVVAVTPNGSFALIECTLRVAEFHAKLGKLVDRRQSLLRTFQDSGHVASVDAFLVTSQERSQLAIDNEALSRHGVTLLCREELVSAFNQFRFPSDPDKLLENARAARAIRGEM